MWLVIFPGAGSGRAVQKGVDCKPYKKQPLGAAAPDQYMTAAPGASRPAVECKRMDGAAPEKDLR